MLYNTVHGAITADCWIKCSTNALWVSSHHESYSIYSCNSKESQRRENNCHELLTCFSWESMSNAHELSLSRDSNEHFTCIILRNCMCTYRTHRIQVIPHDQISKKMLHWMNVICIKTDPPARRSKFAINRTVKFAAIHSIFHWLLYSVFHEPRIVCLECWRENIIKANWKIALK